MNRLTFSDGDQIPQLGLGTWLSAKGEVYDAIRTAISIGYRHFDCAAIYANEKEIGQAFGDAIHAGDIQREELWITSKLWNSSHGKERVRPAFEKSVADLQLDYLDLYLIHWPVAMQPGVSMASSDSDYRSLEEVPLQQTWEGMVALKESGDAKHIGVSNFSAKKVGQIIQTGVGPEMNQVEMHPYLRQQELVDFCQGNGVHLTAYSPLGRPNATNEADVLPLINHPEVTTIAADHSCEPAQVLIAWALQRGTIVIPKSVSPKRLQTNFDSQKVHLSPEQMGKINALDQHFRFVDGTFWTDNNAIYSLETLWDE